MNVELHESVDAHAPVHVPEILAPVGGREQFFAALNSGADAVFLGLKRFNARARAENFSADDLRELLPLAKRHGMKVLVTLNVLVKQAELGDLVEVLAMLEDLEVDAIIVQDVAVAALVRRHFPGLRLHASTQLAVHNLAGVRTARSLGFRRVVLARELTAQELRGIRRALPRDEVEIEAFCHGSLCYSYSGLCFFSGAQDSRSGNRGECAYTCRKPYRILNEPGHGFLFSMRDLDTADDLDLLVGAGVDTLKIEGRKKDAQYVSTVVKTYRAKLDAISGRDTLRPEAPAVARDGAAFEDLDKQLGLTFQRERTSFFLKGRYHENVIDLDNPTHKGLRVGEVLKVDGRWARVVLEEAIERFDGLRIDPAGKIFHARPQQGPNAADAKGMEALGRKYEGEVVQFSLREMRARGRRVPSAEAGEQVEFEVPPAAGPMPRVGDVLYKTRSASLKARIEKISQPGDHRLAPLRFVDASVTVSRQGDQELTITCVVSKLGQTLFAETLTVHALRPERPERSGALEADLRDLFSVWGNEGVVARELVVEGADLAWFVPRSRLKGLKNDVGARLIAALEALLQEKIRVAREETLALTPVTPLAHSMADNPRTPARFACKVDRLETLDAIASWLGARRTSLTSPEAAGIVEEIVFEPKRMFLASLDPAVIAREVLARVDAVSRAYGRPVALRVALPTVVRAWDEPLLKLWMRAFAAAGVTRFEFGNAGAFAHASQWELSRTEAPLDLASDFTLYALNAIAAREWSRLGIGKVALSIEDDATDLAALLDAWPTDAGVPQVILYKDTPLFIAESCSLTALHNGCPTAEVCGYRTLEIENEEGERFFVAHENCKSIVYGKDAFSLTQERAFFAARGVRDFRVDFLTRPYTESAVHAVLDAAFTGRAVEGGDAPGTHPANFHRTLL